MSYTHYNDTDSWQWGQHTGNKSRCYLLEIIVDALGGSANIDRNVRKTCRKFIRSNITNLCLEVSNLSDFFDQLNKILLSSKSKRHKIQEIAQLRGPEGEHFITPKLAKTIYRTMNMHYDKLQGGKKPRRQQNGGLFGFDYKKYGKKCNLEDFRDLCHVHKKNPKQAEGIYQRLEGEYRQKKNKYCESHLHKFYHKKIPSKHSEKNCKKALKALSKHPPKVTRPLPTILSETPPTSPIQSKAKASKLKKSEKSLKHVEEKPTSQTTNETSGDTSVLGPDTPLITETDKEAFQEIENLIAESKDLSTDSDYQTEQERPPKRSFKGLDPLKKLKDRSKHFKFRDTLHRHASRMKDKIEKDTLTDSMSSSQYTDSDLPDLNDLFNTKKEKESLRLPDKKKRKSTKKSKPDKAIQDLTGDMGEMGKQLSQGVSDFHLQTPQVPSTPVVPRGLPFLPQIILPNWSSEYDTPLNINDVLLIGFSVFPYIGWIFDIFMIFRALLEKRWIYAVLMVINWYQWFFWKVLSFGAANVDLGPLFKLFYVGPYASKYFSLSTVTNKFIHFVTDLSGNFPTQVNVIGGSDSEVSQYSKDFSDTDDTYTSNDETDY